MKVAKADISSIVTSLCQQLQNLKSKIRDNVSDVNEEELKAMLLKLHHDANQLTREINQSKELAPLEAKLKKDLKELIFSIQHVPAFSQALGSCQSEILATFRRIDTSLQKFEQKVSLK